LPAQLSGAQIVPDRYLWQPPAPSQVPSVPQEAGACTAQAPRGSGTPPGTDLHWPSDEGSAQL